MTQSRKILLHLLAVLSAVAALVTAGSWLSGFQEPAANIPPSASPPLAAPAPGLTPPPSLPKPPDAKLQAGLSLANAATTATTGAAPATADTPHVTVTWTVRPGDDLWSIAQQVLGQTLGREATQAETTSYWAPLLAANAPTLADPNVLYAGQLVMLPATSELNPKPTAPLPAGSPPAAPDSGAVQRPDPAASAPRISDTAQLPDAAQSGTWQSGTWTVQPGDDLWSIARQVPGQTLGRVPTQAETTSYWAALIAANSAALSDPNLLYAGQVLTLASSAPPNPRPNPPITPGSPPVTGGSSAVQQPEPAAPAPRISDTPHLPDATRSGTWTVRDGEDLWSITQEVLTQTLGRAPSEADTTSYWRALIAANSPALTDPNVLFAGQLLTLPPTAQPSQQPAQNPQGPAG